MLTISALAFAAIAPAFGSLSRRSGPEQPECAAKNVYDLPALYRARSAAELELDGKIEAAAAAFRAELTSSNACVRQAAVAGFARFDALRERFGPAYHVLVDVAALSAQVQTPIVLLTMLVLLTLALGWLISLAPLAGTRIDEFPVYGAGDPLAARQFRDALLAFANDIKRVYSSEFASNVGMTLLLNDLRGNALQSDSLYDQALAGLAEPDAKAAVRFALTHLIRSVRDAAQRPEFLISGDVRLFPGSAKAIGTMVSAKNGAVIRIEANTTELDDLPVKGFVQSALLNPPAVELETGPWQKAEELRRTASQLYRLALVLACKIRYAEAQLNAQPYKPNSWQTLCVLVAGALVLE